MVFMESARYSCQILMKLEFSRQFSENTLSNFMKIRPVGAELCTPFLRDVRKKPNDKTSNQSKPNPLQHKRGNIKLAF